MRTLAVDAQTVEVMSALAAGGVDALLLKGPSIARLLYDDGELRPYSDTDILASPRTLTTAEDVLAGLGFRRDVAATTTALIGSHGCAWRRVGSPRTVDLHHTLPGVQIDEDGLWTALQPHVVVELSLLGCVMATLAPAAIGFHVAVHAVQHGPRATKPLADLERALTRIGDDDWHAAAALAERVDALDAFGVGLRTLPAGAARAVELGVPQIGSRRMTMIAMGAPSLSIAAERLQSTRGWRARLALLLRKTFPPADFVRMGWPIARKGKLGLVAAYPWRLLTLVRQTIPAVKAWRLAGHETPASSSGLDR